MPSFYLRTRWAESSDSQIRFYPVRFSNNWSACIHSLQVTMKTNLLADLKQTDGFMKLKCKNMRVNPSLMSQRDDTGLLSNRSDRCVRYRVDIVKNLKVTEVSNTGIDVVPMQVPSPVQTSIPVPDVPVLMLYRTCRSVPCRYWCCTENTEVHGIGMKVCTGTGGIGIYIVSNLPRRPVPVIPVVYKARYVPHRTHPWKIKWGGEINTSYKTKMIILV